MIRDAVISPCGKYRYLLKRIWAEKRGLVCVIGHNPSTADADTDDPTIRREIRFVERLGYGGLLKVNWSAYRATDPKELTKVPDAEIAGPGNLDWVKAALSDSVVRIAAWGVVRKEFRSHVEEVKYTAQRLGFQLMCFGRTKDGFPRHPLYVRASEPLVRYA